MKSEQEKYLEALYKAVDLLNDVNEMSPETKVCFLNDILRITGMQHLLLELQNYMSNR